MYHHIILFAEPFAVKTLVFRLSVDDDGGVCGNFIIAKRNETNVFGNVRKYAFAVRIAVLPLVDASAFQRLLGVADNFKPRGLNNVSEADLRQAISEGEVIEAEEIKTNENK